MLKCEVIGNLGADAKMQQTDNGKFASFNVAHSRHYRVNGQKVEETLWVSVTVNWNCENLMQYLVKGTKVFVAGTMRLRVFTGNDGKPHAGVTIMADTIELCGSPKVETNTPDEPPF